MEKENNSVTEATETKKKDCPKWLKAIGNAFASFGKWFAHTKRGIQLILVALCLFVIGLGTAAFIDNNGGKVDVVTLKYPTENGQYVAADLYKPKTATASNKAPAVIICPGFQRTKETQQAWTTELARRGFVVIVMDPYSQGDSSASDSTQAASAYGYGLFSLIDYITTPSTKGGYVLNYIDTTRIGAAGHSAGGNAVVKAASLFGQEVIDGLRKTSRLSSIYVSGYIRGLSNDVPNMRSNVGISYAYYDEGAYQNKDSGVDSAKADARYAPEVIEIVNSGLTLNGEEKVTEVEIGEIYGNQFNHNLRIVNNEKTIHAFQPYHKKSIANFLSYWELALDVEFSISANNQVWIWRELGTALMLAAGMLLVLGLGDLLLRTKFFGSLRNELPAKQDHKGAFSKIMFWTIFVIGTVAACFLFIPACELAKTWFAKAQGGAQTWFFPERMNNGVMLWALFSGSVGFVLFFACYFINRFVRKRKADLSPFKIKVSDLGKTILLVVILFATFYSIDLLTYIFFHVDFRFFFISARPVINPKMFLVLLMYLPLFFVFYFSNSVRVNLSMRLDGWKEWQSTLLACVANSIGLVMILVIQYAVFFSTGQVYWTTNWLYCNMLWGVIVMMFILPIFNRFFFNRTGKLYLGPLVSCSIFIMMMLANSVCYLPF